jgi:hypothetical protein
MGWSTIFGTNGPQSSVVPLPPHEDGLEGAGSEDGAGERHCHFHAGVEYAPPAPLFFLTWKTGTVPDEEIGIASAARSTRRLRDVSASTETTIYRSGSEHCLWC